jgi:high affinity cGMP-specific 3',5'-cyclic phosphodiesterase 9
MKHTKAVRYNDKSVLENHHCAIAFKLLLDPQNDVFELLSEAQYWNVRQIIVKMIMSSDISNHFEQISKFGPLINKALNNLYLNHLSLSV